TGPEEMEGALAIGEYLVPHALTAFDLMEADPNLALARRILKWIIDGGMKSFSRRDCHYFFKKKIAKVEKLDPAFQILVSHGFLARRELERSGRGGRPSGPHFEVNPRGQNPT
ncbi:MAG: hypothetical protein ACREN8_13035, partial [Candidatus Dormibacteraceae bacterium]